MNEEQIINAIKSGNLEQEVREGMSGNHFEDIAYLNGILRILNSLADRGVIRPFITVPFSGSAIPASWSDIQFTTT